MANTPTPAALILLNAGITGRELAEELDVTPQAVSFQLAGKAAETSHDLLELIEERGGYELASAVSQAIDRARGERLSA